MHASWSWAQGRQVLNKLPWWAVNAPDWQQSGEQLAGLHKAECLRNADEQGKKSGAAPETKRPQPNY